MRIVDFKPSHRFTCQPPHDEISKCKKQVFIALDFFRVLSPLLDDHLEPESLRQRCLLAFQRKASLLAITILRR